jgi:hypothetical protein
MTIQTNKKMKYNLNISKVVYAVILIGLFTGIIETASASSNIWIKAEDAGTINSPTRVASGEYIWMLDGAGSSVKSGDNANWAGETIFVGDVRSPPDVPRYSIFEVNLTASGSYNNPYLKMPGDDTSPGFVVGTFTGPDNRVIEMDGFWDGGNTWKIRMAPTAVGTWTYSTSSSDAGLNGKTGSFNCVPSTSHGFVRIHPDNPYAFAYDDGTPFFWMGDTQSFFYHYESSKYRFDTGTFQSYNDAISLQGFTTGFFGGDFYRKPGNFAENEGGYNFNDSDPDKLNPVFWQWVDKRVGYAVSRELVPGMGLGWPDQGICSFGDERLMRGLRYLIARYAAYNVMWDLFGEADEYGPGWEDWTRQFGNATKKFDPYDHITSTHHRTRTAPDIGSDSWLDINIEQIGEWSYIIPDRAWGKPVVNVEFGYEGSISSDEIRKRAWGIMTHGGYFQYGENLDPDKPGRTYCKYLALFFTQKTSFWLLQPHNEYVTSGYCTAIPGQEYVIYLPSGGSTTVDLSAATGTLDAEWYDPKDGTYHNKRTVTGGGSVTFTPPFSGDAVLYIVSDGHQQRGDLNGDGQITSADVLIALWMAVRGEHTPEADMNRDGMVTSLDAFMILQVGKQVGGIDAG